MGEPTDLLNVLAELRRRYPAWRFGQMIANIAGWADQEVWDIKDHALLEAACSHLEAVASRDRDALSGPRDQTFGRTRRSCSS